MNPSAAIPVVCALIHRDGLLLVAQRPAHKHLGLKWEFPGGKVEAGESPESALRREIREELGCGIVVTSALPRSVHRYGNLAVEMIPFACRLDASSPEPHPHEHAAIRWIAPAELATFDLAPADVPIVAAYLRAAGPSQPPAAPLGPRS